MKYITLLFINIILLTDNILAQVPVSECAAERIRHFHDTPAEAVDIRQMAYDARYVKLELNMGISSNTLSGIATMRSVALSSLNQYVLELHSNLTIDSVQINGSKCSFTRSGSLVIIAPPGIINAGSSFESKVFYRGTPPNGGFFNGLSNAASPTWKNRITWSLSEPYNAHHWWPCKQALRDKLDSSDVWVICDTGLLAGSNGLLKNITPINDTLHRLEWHNSQSIAYYLISVAVGGYIDYSFNVSVPGIANPVLVQNYIYDNPQTLPYYKSEIDKTSDMLKFFSKAYGPYPFASQKYGHCMAPFSGGMEHNTMTTLGVFNTGITAHELAHQWFGDHVTCSDWKNIWVNEGFARYSEYLYMESIQDPGTQAKINGYVTNAMKTPGGSVFVPDTTNPSRIFSGQLTYDKGACIIHTLRFMINNDSLFFETLKQYQKLYSHSNASAENFRKVAEQVTHLPLYDFFQQWFYGEGYPTYHLKYNVSSMAPQDNYFLGKLIQQTSIPSVTSLFTNPLEIRVKGKNYDTTFRVSVSRDTGYFSIQWPYDPADTPVLVQIDPNQWVIDDTGTVSKDGTIALVSVKGVKSNRIFSVFPNPAHHSFQLYAHHRSDFILSDASGRIVRKFSAEPNGHTVECSGLPAGIYFIRELRASSKGLTLLIE